MREICKLKDVKDFYDSDTVIYDFNNMLIGRWHSGVESTSSGQEEMEMQIAKYARLPELNARPNGGLVMDFGSGVGTTICYLAKKYPNLRFVGLNVSPKQVELATRQSIEKGVQERVRFKLYDGYKIPYKPNTFDAIIFFESICHVPHKQFLFQQLYKILKPNCYISGQDWNSSEKTDADTYKRYILPIEVNFAIPSLLKPSEYDNLMTKSGFNVTHVGDIKEAFPWLVDDSFRHSEIRNDYEQEATFKEFGKLIKDLASDYIYRFKNNMEWKWNKSNPKNYDPNLKKQLDQGYSDLDIATNAKIFTIGFFCANKKKI